MAGKRPTRPQLRSRRRALNSYLLSTESSYADLAKKFGVREDTVKKFLGQDTKRIRSSYNSSPGYQKLYNAAARNNHTSDLRKSAKKEGKRFVEIPVRQAGELPPQYVTMRRKAYTASKKSEKAERFQYFQRARQLREYSRNIERDYEAWHTKREAKALDFQRLSFEKNRPVGLYQFLDTYPDEEEIEEYIDDVVEIYSLSEQHGEALSGRILSYLGG